MEAYRLPRGTALQPGQQQIQRRSRRSSDPSSGGSWMSPMPDSALLCLRSAAKQWCSQAVCLCCATKLCRLRGAVKQWCSQAVCL